MSSSSSAERAGRTNISDGAVERYDLVVIGAGAAGLSAAKFARRLGVRVALIDRELPGGDCLRSGCVPSKTLLRVAKVAWEMSTAERYGLRPAPAEVDLAAVSAHVQATIQAVYQFDRPEALRAEGIDFFAGGGRFLGPDLIQAGSHTLRARRVLICTGSRPIRPAIPGLDDVPYLTSDDVFQVDRLPRSLIVLGTGPVGVELAQAFQRLGSAVTILGRSGLLLRQAEPTIQARIAVVLQSEGVTLRLDEPPIRISRSPGGGTVIETAKGTIQGDALLVASGRQPNVDDLGLDRAGVAADGRGIRVDEHLRTTNPRIYAGGDVVGGPQFSHYAGWQAYIAVRNAFLPGASRGIRALVPWAVFTDPEVATVGLTEAAARARDGDSILTYELDLARVDRAQTDAKIQGGIKVVLRRDGTILGAHIVAPRAGELIQEYILAMDNHLPFDRLASSIHVYPTYATATQQVAVDFWIERLLSGLKGQLIRTLARRRR